MSIQTKTMTVKSDTSLAETTTTIRDTVTFDVSNMPNGITYKGLKAVLSFAEPIQWNRASTYDALTVVWDDASHGSYASKRPVPANIELTNEFYWLRTADLDAQVEMYRQEVMEFDGRITANTEAIASETVRAESAEQALQGDIDSIKATDMIIFGDSWSDQQLVPQRNWWVTTVKGGLNISDERFHNYAHSGATVTDASTDNLSKQVDKYLNDASINKSAAKYIFIMGGVNDMVNFNVEIGPIGTTVVSLVNKLKEKCKNASIYYLCNFEFPYTDYNKILSIQNIVQNSNIDVIQIAGKLSADDMSIHGLYPSDSRLGWYHPSPEGSRKLGFIILNAITGANSVYDKIINPLIVGEDYLHQLIIIQKPTYDTVDTFLQIRVPIDEVFTPDGYTFNLDTRKNAMAIGIASTDIKGGVNNIQLLVPWGATNAIVTFKLGELQADNWYKCSVNVKGIGAKVEETSVYHFAAYYG